MECTLGRVKPCTSTLSDIQKMQYACNVHVHIYLFSPTLTRNQKVCRCVRVVRKSSRNKQFMKVKILEHKGALELTGLRFHLSMLYTSLSDSPRTKVQRQKFRNTKVQEQSHNSLSDTKVDEHKQFRNKEFKHLKQLKLLRERTLVGILDQLQLIARTSYSKSSRSPQLHSGRYQI